LAWFSLVEGTPWIDALERGREKVGRWAWMRKNSDNRLKGKKTYFTKYSSGM